MDKFPDGVIIEIFLRLGDNQASWPLALTCKKMYRVWQQVLRMGIFQVFYSYPKLTPEFPWRIVINPGQTRFVITKLFNGPTFHYNFFGLKIPINNPTFFGRVERPLEKSGLKTIYSMLFDFIKRGSYFPYYIMTNQTVLISMNKKKYNRHSNFIKSIGLELIVLYDNLCFLPAEILNSFLS